MDIQAAPDVLLPNGLASLAQPDLEPMLQDPARFDGTSAWFGHVPFASWLMQAARPRLLLEIGTGDGVSYSAFCQAVQRLLLPTRCFAVHPSGGGGTFEDFHAQHFAGFSRLLRPGPDAAPDRFDDGSIDLLHLDGPGAAQDLEAWLPKLSERAVVLLHGTADRGDGVGRLWAELSSRHPSFGFVHGKGLGVLCMGTAAPDAVLALCRVTGRPADRLRGLFAALGARWEAAFLARHGEHGIAGRDALIREQESRIAGLESRRRTAEAAATARGTAEAADLATRAARTEAALARARAMIGELRKKVAPLRTEQAAREAAERSLVRVEAERDWLLSSTSWRLTAPLRKLSRMTPGSLRRHARRAAKLAWWAATPWRLPLRLRLRQERLAFWAEQARRLPPPPPANADEAYERWIAAFEPPVFIQIGEDPRPPVSVLLPTAGQDERTAATIESLLRQEDAGWTLVVPDGPEARSACAGLANDRRLVFAPCAPEADRGGILAALLDAAPDAWVLVLDSGDVLAPLALKWLAVAVTSEPRTAAVYADEDVLGAEGRRTAPQFKPDWSPELLTAYNYPGRPVLLSRDLARTCGGFAAGQGDAAEWDLMLRLADAAGGRPIRRLPAVLCHRAAGGSRDRPAPGTRAAGERRAALQAFWERRGHRGVSVSTQADGTCRATWSLAERPLVSIVIPNHNSPDLLRRCLRGLFDRTEYRAFEVLVVENNSDDPEVLAMYAELPKLGIRVLPKHGAFNYSAACNHGARAAKGPLLLFLNNDVEVQDPGWLGELVRVASLPGVGVVGTKLRYPDGTVQHAGVAAGPHLLGLMFHRTPDEAEWGVFGSPNVQRNWSAVMGACQMVRREAFDQVGGFDEVFELANSDIVLCLRAGQLGFRTVYAPQAAIIHHEGTTRGRQNPAADMARSARELQRLGLEDDPFFHPGLSGNNPIPTLRAPDEPNGQEALRVLAQRFLGAVPASGPVLDLFDDAAVLAEADLPRAHVIPIAIAGAPVADRWDAARWIITLLRSRPDLRMRFPHALTEGADGAFAAWLAAGTEGEMALPPGLADQLEDVWSGDLARRPRQVYVWRDDVHQAHPVGLLPPGYAAYLRYLFRDGQFEYRFRLEEAWWFLLCNAERPAAELVRTYRFNVEWQRVHPLGLTVFGRDALAAWIGQRYGLDSATAWLDPATWPDQLPAADQVRLAYASSPSWQRLHPTALREEGGAAALLAWLAGPDGNQVQPVRRWCADGLRTGLPAAVAGLAVNVLGHFCYPSGLRVSVESASDAMKGVGIAVSCRDIRTHLNDDPPHTSVGGLETADVTLIHTQPGDLFLKAYERADLAPRDPRTFRIGYWYWELDEAPAEWGPIARSADEVWTATEFVAAALRRVVDVPVHVLFPGVRIGAFTPTPREALGAPGRGDGRFAFLFSFHMASITERKNPHGLIRAFRQAFAPHEAVDLVIKTTSEARHAAELAELRAATQGANITVIDAVFTPEQTLALMDGCDAYVSLHRAEGLGLGMAEAMLLGKPVIATRYSGNLQFMDDGNSLLVDCTVGPIGRAIAPYTAEARWAEPSVDHAARLMRQLFDDQDAARALGRRAQAAARDTMSLDAAGRRMAARLAAIRSARPPA